MGEWDMNFLFVLVLILMLIATAFMGVALLRQRSESKRLRSLALYYQQRYQRAWDGLEESLHAVTALREKKVSSTDAWQRVYDARLNVMKDPC